MSSSQTSRISGARLDDAFTTLGKLHFLASYCPEHRRWPSSALARLFVPAVNQSCVRLFENEEKLTCAALIWARLSNDVAARMIYQGEPPREDEWTSGQNLWFLDLIAPFDHGRWVARHIARNPPEGPFFFARLGRGGALRKVVQGDASLPRKKRVQAFPVEL